MHAVLWGVLFGLYLIRLHPGISWGDGPELTAAAATLGVPHPPGYPFYTLLGKLTAYIPLGAVAWRLNLLSALCMATAGVLCSITVERILSGPVSASSPKVFRILAGACVAAVFLAPIVWFQAVQTEVYALFVLLCSSVLYFASQIYGSQDYNRAALALTAFVSGLCVVHHYLAAPSAVAALGMILYGVWGSNRIPLRGLASLSWGFAPLALWVVLPLRSMNSPLVDWYNPHTWDGFRGLLFGGDFGDNLVRGWAFWWQAPGIEKLYDLAFGLLAWGPSDAPGGILNITVLAVWSPVWAAALYGLYILWTEKPYVAYVWLFLAACHQLFYMFYMVGDRSTFAVPLVLLWCLPLAQGMISLYEKCREHDLQLAVRAIPIFALLMPLLAIQYNGPPVAMRSLVPARNYGEFVSDALPKGSLLATGTWEATADNEFYPMLYLQAVEHRNENVDIIGAGFIGLSWYRQQLVTRGIMPGLDTKAPEYARMAFGYRQIAPKFQNVGLQWFARKAWLEEFYSSVIRPEMKRRDVILTVSPELHWNPPEQLAPVPSPSWSEVQAATGSVTWTLPISEDIYHILPADTQDYLFHIPGTRPWTGAAVRLEAKQQ